MSSVDDEAGVPREPSGEEPAPARPGPGEATDRPEQRTGVADEVAAPEARASGTADPGPTATAAAERPDDPLTDSGSVAAAERPEPEATDPGEFYSSLQEGRVIKLRRTNDSAIVVGTGSAYNIGQAFIGAERDVDVQAVPCEPQLVARIVTPHQLVDGEGEMESGLREEHLVVLCGQPGSGRQSTAMTLLEKVCAKERMGIVHSDASSIAQALTGRADSVLTAGHGYLVDLGDQPLNLSTVETLGHQAKARRAHLVLMAQRDTVDPEQLRPYAFTHVRPDVRAVFTRHLSIAMAGRHPGTCGEEGCSAEQSRAFIARMPDDPQVRHVLERAPSMRAVVDFALLLAAHAHSGQAGLDEAVNRWRDRLRLLAKEILQVTTAEGAALSTLEPHGQAFRITYALFQGHPLSDVFMAGELLSASVLPRFEQRESLPNNHLFDRVLDQLIPQKMLTTTTAVARSGFRDNPRRAWLVDEELMPAVIEVVWHEYDSLREPLRLWLTRLAGDNLVRVRVRAAQIAGILLGHDFDSVYRDLVGLWARGNAVYRQGAALAMEMAAGDEQLAPRIRQQVRDWSTSSDWRLQDAAARTYGTLVGGQDADDAIWSLRELGRRPELARLSSVAYSMALLFLGGAAKPVADALGEWIDVRNDHLPRHAVRTMLALGRFSAAPDLQDRPVLAHLAMQDSMSARVLLRSWRLALAGQDDAERAWDLLERWLVSGDEDPDFAGFLRSLVPGVCVGPLRGRALFHLGVWCRRHPDGRLLAEIRRRLEGGQGPTS
ncbi:hypothetical protein [Streptomyces sp. NBC_01190]|uniref:hypothetical protein n=1 Tax=Streptomyces sp. NBC_01190 TaxID=2903767 RepID=UPI00386FC8E5|nr:hypothetical protein OG519_13650 [Streptomyces sp. NBC_01190]